MSKNLGTSFHGAVHAEMHKCACQVYAMSNIRHSRLVVYVINRCSIQQTTVPFVKLAS